MLIAIVSDTHLPRGTRALPETALECMRDADLILHAGDLMERSVLEELRAVGPPVEAIHGNADSAELKSLLPAARLIDAEGASIAMTHNGGPAARRLARLRKRFPDADAVIFGHSHIPVHETDGAGFQIFNPGSASDRRRMPHHTMGMARAEGGRVTFELVTLD